MNQKAKDFLKNYSNDLHIVNKLIVSAYLQFNNIQVKNNIFILSLLSGNDKNEVAAFVKIIKNHTNTFELEDVINLFEITIPESYQIVNGAVYTPKYIREFIVEHALENINFNSTVRIADISCGAGAFLYTAAKEIYKKTEYSLCDIFKNNIFGLDIAGYALDRTKILLTLLAIDNDEDIESFDFNLYKGNTLNFNWNNKYKNFNGFDAIIGNPPYVRTKNLDSRTKMLMRQWQVANSGNSDLYIPFFEIGIRCLKKNGFLGYITVNTFKRSVNARDLRKFFSSNSVDLNIIDFGNYQVFDKKMTYTSIVFIHNKASDYIKYIKISPKKLKLFHQTSMSRINYDLLDNHKGWILADADILKNIYLIENAGTPLGKKFGIKNGLATLQNSLFIFKPTKEDKNFFYMFYDGKEYKIEKGVCKDVIKPNKLKSEDELINLKEKIIFPYVVTHEKVKVMEEDFFQQVYPYAYQYLLKYKNLLMQRDKNKEKKYKWFEFGRSQSINDTGKKLLFPYMSNKPYFVYCGDENLLFYAGYAIYGESERDLKVIKKILKSKVFWYYIEHTSKPYSSNYFALAKNYVKDFGICELSEEEEEFLLKTKSKAKIDEFLISKYGLKI